MGIPLQTAAYEKHAKYNQCLFVCLEKKIAVPPFFFLTTTTGTRLFYNFQDVNIMYITEKCEYVFVQNQTKK